MVNIKRNRAFFTRQKLKVYPELSGTKVWDISADPPQGLRGQNRGLVSQPREASNLFQPHAECVHTVIGSRSDSAMLERFGECCPTRLTSDSDFENSIPTQLKSNRIFLAQA